LPAASFQKKWCQGQFESRGGGPARRRRKLLSEIIPDNLRTPLPASLGEMDEALRYFQKALDDRSPECAMPGSNSSRLDRQLLRPL
jgi:hypothetical protein